MKLLRVLLQIMKPCHIIIGFLLLTKHFHFFHSLFSLPSSLLPSLFSPLLPSSFTLLPFFPTSFPFYPSLLSSIKYVVSPCYAPNLVLTMESCGNISKTHLISPEFFKLEDFNRKLENKVRNYNGIKHINYQFSSIQSLSRVRLFTTP